MEIMGMRDEWEELIIHNSQGYGIKGKPKQYYRSGYLTCLYALRNSFLPRAYERSPEIKEFEKRINHIIGEIEENWP